jgi:hypothetical protein
MADGIVRMAGDLGLDLTKDVRAAPTAWCCFPSLIHVLEVSVVASQGFVNSILPSGVFLGVHVEVRVRESLNHYER